MSPRESSETFVGEIDDKSLMLIMLLEECNQSCAHCIREDEPMDPGYKLTFEQFRICLSDCLRLDSIRWIHFSGGEPTLWTEENLNLVDLLLGISSTGFIPGFTTNGRYFTDRSRCDDFFRRYVDSSTTPLRIYLTIDTFHGNFSATKGRAQSLDNILQCKQKLQRAKADLLNIRAMAVISRDVKSLLPDEMIRHYESRGVTFGFMPLLSMGKAKSFSHLCPDLNHDDLEGLGAYHRFYRRENRTRRDEAKHRDRVDHINLIGNDYYFANPWRKVAQLGNLPEEIIRAYANEDRA